MKKHACLFALSLFGSIAVAQPAVTDKTAAMTIDAAVQTMKVSDDPYEAFVLVSSTNFYSPEDSYFESEYKDVDLNAMIDRKTLKASFFLYFYNVYEGNWRFLDRVAFITKQGPQSIYDRAGNRKVLSCSGRSRSCSHSESITIPLPADLVHAVASEAAPPSPASWTFKVSGGGYQTEYQILKTEFAALVAATDRQIAKMKPTP